MKLLPLLLLPLVCSSCALLQMPARLVNSVLGPLVDAESQTIPSPSASIALKTSSPATKQTNPKE